MALVVVALFSLRADVTADNARFEVGRRLAAVERAWQANSNADARREASEPLARVVSSYFTFNMPEAARALDEAWLLLAPRDSAGEDAKWGRSLCVTLGERLVALGGGKVDWTLAEFYPSRVELPAAASVLWSLRGLDQDAVLAEGTEPIDSLPMKRDCELPALAEGDYRLTFRVMVDDREVTGTERLVSCVENLDKRLARLQAEIVTWPRLTDSTDRETVRGMCDTLLASRGSEGAETNPPLARMLAEAEAAAGATRENRSFYGKERAGRQWLTLAIHEGRVPARVFAPEKARSGDPLPLVVALHGAGGSENMFFEAYGNGAIVDACDRRDWLLVAPRTGHFAAPDVASIVDAVTKLYPVDRSRVYIVGHSMGAANAIVAVQRDPDRYAAVAALAGAGAVKRDAPIAKVPFFVAVGSLDFSLGPVRVLRDKLTESRVRRLEYREYEDVEHMAIVQTALNDVFEFFATCALDESADETAQVETEGDAAETRAASERMNVLVIMVDDLGWRDTGFSGNGYVETPNLDRLARESVRFTNAYAACPVCSPTRAAFVTGQYPARLHLTAHIPRNGVHENPASSPIVVPPALMRLPLEEVTIAERLRDAGYTTASVGKWHLGDRGYLPDDQGFEVAFAGDSFGSPPSFFFPYGLARVEGGRKGEYLTDRLTDEAVAFLDRQGKRPFFLYLSHFGVHTPIEAKSELVARFAGKPSPTGGELANAHYAAMIASVDESVGRVLAKLDELGVADRTAIVFTSDNGGLHVEVHEAHYSSAHTPATTNAPLREGKGWMYEGGVRVPLLIKWPGGSRNGETCEVPTSTVDLYPTILDMTGVGEPAAHVIDGESLEPLLLSNGKLERDAIYWHYPHYNPQGGKPCGAIREGDFKLIEYYEDGRVELFDLAADPAEERDLARERAMLAEHLRTRLDDWRAAVGAQMPTPRRP